MMRALWSAASGMIGQQTNMDVISHNIANVNTHGGKKVRAEFQDLMYQRLRDAGAEVVIAFPHCGTEYVQQPNADQMKIVEKLMEQLDRETERALCNRSD